MAMLKQISVSSSDGYDAFSPVNLTPSPDVAGITPPTDEVKSTNMQREVSSVAPRRPKMVNILVHRAVKFPNGVIKDYKAIPMTVDTKRVFGSQAPVQRIVRHLMSLFDNLSHAPKVYAEEAAGDDEDAEEDKNNGGPPENLSWQYYRLCSMNRGDYLSNHLRWTTDFVLANGCLIVDTIDAKDVPVFGLHLVHVDAPCLTPSSYNHFATAADGSLRPTRYPVTVQIVDNPLDAHEVNEIRSYSERQARISNARKFSFTYDTSIAISENLHFASRMANNAFSLFDGIGFARACGCARFYHSHKVGDMVELVMILRDETAFDVVSDVNPYVTPTLYLSFHDFAAAAAST